MKKRFKLLNRSGKVHILHWAADGKLFGPDWEAVATFDDKDSNLERCKTIIWLMNECDKHTDHPNDDRTRDNKK
ncbi:hypothetical protein [Duncaniella freteri]|uniref:Uncharacterized protein n=1 Tax=Duncaniella freteri TaxID=2530391 RepID=A0A4Z0V3Z0_9BACT|nr:hypothetical protein [Duncaniella freteri]TGG34961.1 hypothetical protein EZ315_16010 [Duncaniella freteri]TGG36563.1 hypothetical protein EZ315_12030 [Duncaniella freteri]